MSTANQTLLSFDLQRNCYIKNVVLSEENSILPLPERLESSTFVYLLLPSSTFNFLLPSSTFSAERERGGVPRGSSRPLGDPPWGLSLSAEKVEEGGRKLKVEEGGRR